MNIRSVIIGLVAIVIATIAALAARNIMGRQVPKSVAQPFKQLTQKTEVKIMTAAKSFSPGHIIVPDDIRWTEWPNGAVTDQYFKKGVDTEQSAVGKVIKVAVVSGAPLVRSGIVGPGERGFLAAVLTPGMRAVTVAVTDTSAVGGFVFPGDRVDLVLTYEVPQEKGLSLKGAETILTNVRVLAVDQKTEALQKDAAVPRSVTLEVPPTFVGKIAVMQRLGSISLSLRGLSGGVDSAIRLASPNGQSDALLRKLAAANAGAIEQNIQPSDKQRSLVLDRQVSRLASLATFPKQQVAPDKPDLVVARGAQHEDVFFRKNGPPNGQGAATDPSTGPAVPPVSVTVTGGGLAGLAPNKPAGRQ